MTVWILMILFLAAGCSRQDSLTESENTTAATAATLPAETESIPQWQTGYIASRNPDVPYYSESGAPLGSFLRGTRVEYEITPEGKSVIYWGNSEVFLGEEGDIAEDPANVIPAHTLYIRTTVNLRDSEGRLLPALGEKGAAVQVTGYDYLLEDGGVHMYQVEAGEDTGYILPWYLTELEEDALAVYDGGSYAIHADRGNRYGGGGAGDLDYYPREKGPIADNEMPEECRTLYLTNWCLENVDAYLEIADNSGINAFVVDITDGGSIGYAADVINQYCPTGATQPHNTVEAYQEAIGKLKDAGYYVIGRITTFNDSCFVADHPETAISDLEGNPIRLAGEYWPSPYDRSVWQYKVDLAVEAVQLMGFHEIQFDYVRFPDSTWDYEQAGTIDFHNTYAETKAQAIQRFLMYAADILHEQGVYVSADVYGESAFTYVTAYGQYWPAISNVVDAISGMPYPDHFGASGSWLPWEHPYDTLYSWGLNAMDRQGETATPGAVRTWIQAYNAIRKPYTTYGPDQVYAQIRGLRDAGCTGGYMTWNASASLDKYTWLMSAFEPPEE